MILLVKQWKELEREAKPKLRYAETTTLDMEWVPNAYSRGERDWPGWLVPKHRWDIWMLGGGEYIQDAMYGGGNQSCGCFVDDFGRVSWSWTVLPEDMEEAAHLRNLGKAHDKEGQ